MDPSLIIERVIQRALVNSVDENVSHTRQDVLATEDLIVDLLGNRLAQVLAADSPNSGKQDSSVLDYFAGELAHYQELMERNNAVAAALGACDCWGEHEDCAVCQGAGTPGWAVPDKRLFSRFVQPALRTISALTIAKPRVEHKLMDK
jgi:hypothetical protein